MAVSAGTVYVGGLLGVIGGQHRDHLAAIDAATGAATPWNPDADEDVGLLAASGNTVYAAGLFTRIGGLSRQYLAALDATTGAATAWNPNPDGVVQAMAVSGGTVYVGGAFASIGGQPRHYLAALDATSSVPTTWNPDANRPVYALAVSGTTAYAGGSFFGMGSQPQSGLGAIITDVPTATLLAQFDATSSADGIELRWSFGDPSRVAAVAVERALQATGPWVSIDPELRVTSDGTVALDRTADGSGECFYRLVAQLTDGSEAVFGPVSASRDEPLAMSRLTLKSPNPTPGGIHVQYAVARAGQVRLDLLDVSGRVVATLADRAQEPGRYEAAWDGVGPRGQLSPGLYFVRFMAPDCMTVRKLAVVR